VENLLITHSDLDGVGAAIAVSIMLKSVRTAGAVKDRQSVIYTDYANVDNAARKGICDPNAVLYITDICPGVDTVNWLIKSGKFFHLIDHHKTRQWVQSMRPSNKDQVIVFDAKKSAALLAYELYRGMSPSTESALDQLHDFFQAVDAYDMWRLKSEYRDYGVRLHRRLQSVGLDKFFHTPSMWLEHHPVDAELALREQMYVDKAVREACLKVDSEGRCCVYTEVSEHVSRVCHDALNKYPRAIYAVNNNAEYGKLDFRSRNDGDFDVSEVATPLGGGGHKYAAGCILTPESEEYLAQLQTYEQ
jgi:oligoribonuclease NrnB/cAMP/cGMP phosphodiesterase (DHH superfamily)